MIDPSNFLTWHAVLPGLPWLIVGALGGASAVWLWRLSGWRRAGRPKQAGTPDQGPGIDRSPCRIQLHQRLQAALTGTREDDQAPALIVLNLDNFRMVNDGLGHAAGDLLLSEMAARIKASLRGCDTPARIGADEFMILLQGISDANRALDVANRLRIAVSRPYLIQNQELNLTCSLGIALAPRHGRSADDLIRSATAAMSLVKRRGGDGAEFPDATTTGDLTDRLRLEADLRRALDLGQFELYFQPKYALDGSQSLLGAEALVRWNHPERGLVLPADFIPFAEETGLINPIGDWVLREALSTVGRWRDLLDEEDVPTVAVNLSFRQFDRPDIFELVRDRLDDSRANPRHLELELTESIVMRNPESTIDTLTRLRSLGVRLAIDDFGVGYSSLGLLKRLPVHTIKIDRSFMNEVPSSGEDTVIASAIIGLAHTLGYSVVAEGVEKIEQLEFLKAHSCDAVQGYLMGRPMTEAEFDKLLTRIRPSSSGPSRHSRAHQLQMAIIGSD